MPHTMPTNHKASCRRPTGAIMTRCVGLILTVGLLVTACSTAPRPNPYSAQAQNTARGEMVTVEPGDTVYSVARRYRVSMNDLIALNGLQAPFQLVPGRTIALPAQGGQMMEVLPTAMAPPAQGITVIEGKKSYANAFDEFNSSTAGQNGVTTYSQVAPTPLAMQPAQPLSTPIPITAPMTSDEKVIYVPEGSKVIYMPRGTAPPRMAAPAAPEKPKLDKSAVAQALNLKPMVYDKHRQQLKEKPEDRKQASTSPLPAQGKIDATPSLRSEKIIEESKEKSSAAAEKMEAPAPGRFIWPVQGTVLSGFGPKESGMRNDGVNIGAPRGTPVAAADGGTVAYAGSDIPGYGNVVLVRHPDGWMTTYGHLERTFVQRDAVVAKGDMLGTVGSSGGLSSPQLHFEIRRGNEAVNPEKYLARR